MAIDIRHAPMLSERWLQMNAEQFSGVWLYDITERFGREWAEELLNRSDARAEERLESIVPDATHA